MATPASNIDPAFVRPCSFSHCFSHTQISQVFAIFEGDAGQHAGLAVRVALVVVGRVEEVAHGQGRIAAEVVKVTTGT